MLKNKIIQKSVNSHLDFAPYAYHYKNNAIITKNGEIVIVIKLCLASNEEKIKDLLKQFFETRRNSSISFWITTIRSKDSKKFISRNEVEKISDRIIDSYYQEFWHTFYNEIYISIVIGDHADLTGLNKNLNPFARFSTKSYSRAVQNAYNKCIETSDVLMELLKKFKPKLLTNFKKNDIYYSELLTFFSRIIHAANENTKVTTIDLSNTMLSGVKYDLAYNVISTSSRNVVDSSIFLALFSIVDNQEISAELMNDLLEIDHEMVSTEILQFNKEDVFSIEKNKFYKNDLDKYSEFNLSRDMSFDYFVKSFVLPKNITVNRQNNICIKSNTIKNLNKACDDLIKKFRSHAIPIYRHNVFTEEVFWSQLPGNFKFVTRLNPSEFKTIASFNNITVDNETWYREIFFKRIFDDKKIQLNIQNKDLILFHSQSSAKANDLLRFFVIHFLKYDVKIDHFYSNFELNIDNNLEDQSIKIEMNNEIKGLFSKTIVLIAKKLLLSQDIITNQLESLFVYFKENKFSFENFINFLKTSNLINIDFDILNQSVIKQHNSTFLKFDSIGKNEYLILMILRVCIAAIFTKHIKKQYFIFLYNLSEYFIDEDDINQLKEIILFALSNKIKVFCDLSYYEKDCIDAYQKITEKKNFLNFYFFTKENASLMEMILDRDIKNKLNDDSAIIDDNANLAIIDSMMSNFMEKSAHLYKEI